MTFSITTLSITARVPLCLVSQFIYCYAECHYAVCRYAECNYAECHYAKCRYAECRGAVELVDNRFK
jgi:hypothetical protein